MYCTPRRCCAPIMSAPSVQSAVAEPCQLSPPSERRKLIELIGRLRLALPGTWAGARRRRECEEPEEFAALQLLVDRRGGVEQKRHEILDLLRRQRSRGAEARHLRAQVVRLGVIDLAVDVALHFGARAANLAEATQARADRAVRELARRELVAVVAAAARGLARLVVP